jgi:PelA/Pel-15E family pectate lyase
MTRFTRYIFLTMMVFTIIMTSVISYAAPSEKEVLDAMRKASTFMVNEVSLNGGYLFAYSADLTEFHGEAPARPTQIWVQSSTPDMGELFLEAYRVAGEEFYLDAAKKAANVLIYGQHPLGGWHYFIDFDMPGLDKWYREVASQFKWGMEEYRHFYGNCTYDDNVTPGAARFLLSLYMTTLEPKYREPLLKVLDFILMSQYPNGAWPQRYPLRYEFAHDGLADYTSYYTMNDNAMRDIINLLIEAYEKLGKEEYMKAALRGADFIIAAQMPEPQAGWAEQYDMDMKPAWARTHEPAGLMPRQSIQCINQLQEIYLMTGDRRYLKPVPGALKWLEESAFEDLGDGKYNLARYYEAETNKPIYQHKTEQVNELGYGIYKYDDDPTIVGLGGWMFTTVDIGAVKRAYNRVRALTPEEAVAEYRAKKVKKTAVPKVNPEKIETLIDSMDRRGAWVEEISVYDVSITMTAERPRKSIQGISTGSFIRNMRTFNNYLRQIRQ